MNFRGIGIGVCLAPVFIFIGCMEPSMRYTRDAEGKVHVMVPADWDYRTSYRVPGPRLKKIADSYLGTTYKSGGMTRKGLDCSGFVCLVFKDLNKATLPRSSKQLWKLGASLSPRDGRPGDLVFFRGGFFGGINHVGILMGNNTFIHASTSNGVIYDTLDEEYYKKHFAGIRRIF
jgi:probable lipoprotein NlpC